MTAAKRRLSLILAAGLLAAGIGGCTDAGGSSPEPSASEPSEDVPRDLTTDTKLSFAEEGRDYRVAFETPSVIEGRLARYIGTAEDGTQVIVRSDLGPELSDVVGDPRGNALVLYDPKSGSSETVAQHGTPDNWLQIVDVTKRGDLAVWIETSSRSLYELPWELYSYNLSSGKETHLASSDDFGIERPPLSSLQGIVPHVTEEFVYFPVVDEVRKGDPEGTGRPSIYRVPLAGGEPELIAKGGLEVFGDLDPELLQVRFPDRIVQWDPRKGPDGEVDGSSLPGTEGSFANDGVRVTVNKAEGVRVESAEHGRFTVSLRRGERAYYLNATERWVSFTVDRMGEQQGYLLDLERGTLVRLRDVINSSTQRMHGNLFPMTPEWDKAPPKTFPVIALQPD